MVAVIVAVLMLQVLPPTSAPASRAASSRPAGVPYEVVHQLRQKTYQTTYDRAQRAEALGGSKSLGLALLQYQQCRTILNNEQDIEVDPESKMTIAQKIKELPPVIAACKAEEERLAAQERQRKAEFQEAREQRESAERMQRNEQIREDIRYGRRDVMGNPTYRVGR